LGWALEAGELHRAADANAGFERRDDETVPGEDELAFQSKAPAGRVVL
jgi:hypothetical protein